MVALVLGAAGAAELGVLPSLSQPSNPRAELALPGQAVPVDLPVDKPAPELAPPPVQAVSVDLPRLSSPRQVLAELSPPGRVARPALEQLLDRAVDRRALGGHFALTVEQLGRDARLFRLGGTAAVTPASLLKLLTAMAALSVLEPDHRFATSVLTGATPHDVVLVGGGDPLLTDRSPSSRSATPEYPDEATLAELARATASRLEKDGVRRVRLTYDASLFSGPAVNPAWRSTYVRDAVVSPISALWIDEGRASTGFLPAVADPAEVAALRFAALLRSAGLVVAAQVSSGRVAPSATRIAVVKSAPLDQIVEHVLAVSDNEGAEVLLRQVALATGRPGSSAAGVKAMRQALARLGIDLSGSTFYDGSGLARRDALPVRVLLDVLQLAADPGQPGLRTVVSSLPVAGFTGSLASRFLQDAPAGLGVVRAKTGTLTGVHGLAGLVVTRSGHGFVFAAVANDVPVRRALAARAQLDSIAALLATCRCAR